jgi:NAD(P)-dependent dehydrogenase (short-subunit alcohol dehydrogenase family)
VARRFAPAAVWQSSRRGDTRLEGKVAVITGAGSGMGRAMTSLFAREGARVVAAEWNAATLDEVAEEVRAAGGTVVGIQGDVSNRDDDRRIIQTAIDTYGQIDILCNNAGIMDNMAAAGDFDEKTLAKVMAVNAYGPLYLINAVLPHFLGQGKGVIVNTASAAGVGGGAAGVVYTMSKHACVGLTKNTAWMYAKSGIRCNAMAVGGVNTGIMANTAGKVADMDPQSLGPARAMAWAGMAPGFGEPIDIANLALFLASDESRFVNGAIVHIDAGWTAA